MTAELTELTRVVEAMPQDMARQVLDFARNLRDQQTPEAVDYGDWTDEDIRDLQIAVMRRIEAEYPNEDWGIDYDAEVNK